MFIRSLEVYYCHFLSLMFNIDGMNNWSEKKKNKGKGTEGRRKEEKNWQKTKKKAEKIHRMKIIMKKKERNKL